MIMGGFWNFSFQCMHVYFRQSFLLGSIKVKTQTLPEINMHTRLFGTLEYSPCYFNLLDYYRHRVSIYMDMRQHNFIELAFNYCQRL